MWRWNSGLLGASLAGLLAVMPAQSSAATADYLPDGPVIGAPHGFLDMCRREQTFCGGARYAEASLAAAATPTKDGNMGDDGDTAALADPLSSAWSHDRTDSSSANLRSDVVYPLLFSAASSNVASTSKSDDELLQRVNHIVNNRVVQKTDLEVWGQAELWHRSGVGPKAAGDCEDIAIEKRFQLIGAGFDPKRLFFAVVYLPAAGLHTVLVARTPDGDMVLDSRTPYIDTWDKTPYSWVAIQSSSNPMVWHSVDKHSTLPTLAIASAS